MKILKFSIIAILLFMTSCVDDFYISNDKGVVINIQKDVDCNQVTIMIINDSVQNGINTCITFPTHKQYSINDTVYFTN
nr:MAG TPA: protein of unknown function (DUF4971) [Caudoviricetes sp.]